MNKYIFKTYLFLPIFFLFFGCSSHKLNTNKRCHYTNLILNSKNNFCSSASKTVTYKSDLFINFNNGDTTQWNINNNKFIKSFNINSISKAIAIDKKYIFTGSNNMSIYKYNFNSSLIEKKNYSKGSIFYLTSFKNYLYVAFGDSELGIVDKDTLKLLKSYKEHDYLIFTICLDQDNGYLYTGSDDNSIIKWKIIENNLIKKVKKINEFHSSVRNILKIKEHFIVTTADGNLFLYDNKFENKLDVTNKNHTKITAILSKNNYIYTGDIKGNINIYKIKNNSLQLINYFKLKSLIRGISYNEQNSIIFITKEGYILSIKALK